SPSGRAEVFANGRGVLAAHDLRTALAQADFVVSCSGTRGHHPANDHKATEPHDEAPGYVLDTSTITAARSGITGGSPRLVILDLALHRDVDPAVGDLCDVTLHDLASLATRTPSLARVPVLTARSVVVEAVRTYDETRLGREADPVVIALVAQAEDRIAAEAAEAIETARRTGTPVDADAVTRAVRRRVRAGLHARILDARVQAVAAARATDDGIDGTATEVAAAKDLATAS
ncbi:MAG: glutamyl-tRNA reductase, partial [Micrococcales bacterium]|nr:glutamyl-tRNA reductase [Micrococcales bacterium]